jgi:hypothetical protein
MSCGASGFGCVPAISFWPDCLASAGPLYQATTDMVDGTNLTWANAYVYHGSSLIDMLVVKQ